MEYKIEVTHKSVPICNVVLEMVSTPLQINGAKEGYYWAYNRLTDLWKIVRYKIDEQGKDCYYCVQGDVSPNYFTRWLGPLPEPEE
jgi:hypothetical protein